jgi:DNA-binding GntR family transcriptional regulator
LARLLAGVVKHLPNHYYASLEGHMSNLPSEHQEIFEALSKHDAKRSRLLIEAHIQGSADVVIDSLEQRGLWRDTATDQS